MEIERNRLATALIIMALLSVIMIAIPEPVKGAKFSLATWDYPDEYGQGIIGVRILENSSGAWLHYDFSMYDDTGIYEWNSSMGIMLQVYVFMNNTLVGSSNYVDGEDYQRVNVTVTDLGGTEVFNDTSLTFAGWDGYAAPLWLYVWQTTLEFTPIDGQYYRVAITYEIWW